jgi:hypothetical protein
MTFQSTIAVVACILIGLALLLAGLYQRKKLESCANWPQVMGTIRKAEVFRDPGPDSNGYFVRVLYDYSVDGAPYEGKKVGFADRAYVRKKSAEDVAERYTLNSSVPVYFNPEKPSEAVLTREYPDNKLLFVCGAGLLALAVIILAAHG